MSSMKSKAEKEKERLTQEKVQTILTSMLRDEDNKYCVDCDSKGPRWASWNLGVFLCIRCAGIHRNLGVHISKVKSVNLDSWTPQQVASMQMMGNSKGRAVYEANIPDDFRRPQTDSAVEAFIRQKYEKKKFIAAEWVATKPPDVPVGWDDLAGGFDTKKVEFKKLQLPAGRGGGTSNSASTSPRAEAKTVVSTAPVSLTVSLPPATTITSTSATSTVTDLLGLSMSSAAPVKPQQQATSSSSQDLLGLNSEFSAFVSASPLPAGPTKPSEPAPQNQQTEVPTPSDGRLSKDSILALFGPKSSPAPAAQSQANMFGQFQSQPGMNQFQSPAAPSNAMPGQFQSPNPGLGQLQAPGSGFGQFQSPLGQFGSQASPNPAFPPSTQHSNLLGLYSQPQQGAMNGFQPQTVSNPFLDTNQMSGQLAGLNLGTAGTASPSLWQ